MPGLLNNAEACCIGNQNSRYSGLIKRVKSIVFLATPHHGSDLASFLKIILSSNGIVPSREYVAELSRDSITLDAISDDFRHHVKDVRLFSFYETIATGAGNISRLVVSKGSSKLGDHGES